MTTEPARLKWSEAIMKDSDTLLAEAEIDPLLENDEEALTVMATFFNITVMRVIEGHAFRHSQCPDSDLLQVSFDQLSDESGLSRSQVKRAVGRVEKAELGSPKNRGRYSRILCKYWERQYRGSRIIKPVYNSLEEFKKLRREDMTRRREWCDSINLRSTSNLDINARYDQLGNKLKLRVSLSFDQPESLEVALDQILEMYGTGGW